MDPLWSIASFADVFAPPPPCILTVTISFKKLTVWAIVLINVTFEPYKTYVFYYNN